MLVLHLRDFPQDNQGPVELQAKIKGWALVIQQSVINKMQPHRDIEMNIIFTKST